MAEREKRTDQLSEAVLAALRDDGRAGARDADVARGRRRAADRSFDDDDVVDAIALRLLALGRPE